MIFSARRLRTFVLAQCLALLAGIPTFALASPACVSRDEVGMAGASQLQAPGGIGGTGAKPGGVGGTGIDNGGVGGTGAPTRQRPGGIGGTGVVCPIGIGIDA